MTEWPERSSEVLSQKDASENGNPEPFFPGIGVTNTIPLKTNL